MCQSKIKATNLDRQLRREKAGRSPSELMVATVNSCKQMDCFTIMCISVSTITSWCQWNLVSNLKKSRFNILINLEIKLMGLCFKKNVRGSIDVISSLHKRLSGWVPVKSHRNQHSNGVFRWLYGRRHGQRVVTLKPKKLSDWLSLTMTTLPPEKKQFTTKSNFLKICSNYMLTTKHIKPDNPTADICTWLTFVPNYNAPNM